MQDRISRVVWLLTVGNGLFALFRFMVMPFLAIYVHTTTGAPPVVVGLVIGVGAAANLVFSFVLGPLSDRIGRKPSLVAGSLVSALALLGFAFARTLAVFAGLEILFGITAALELPAYQALITDVTPPHLRVRAFGYMYWAANAGAAVGALLGGVAGSGHRVTPFMVSGAVGLLLTMGLAVALPKGAGRVPARPVSGLESLRHIGSGLRNPRLLWVLIGLMLISVTYSQIDTSLAQYLGLNYALGTRLYAYMWSANALTVVVMQPLLTRWQEGRPLVLGVVGGAMIYAVATATLIAAGAPWNWIAIMVFFTFGEVLLSPAQQAVVADLAPEDRRAAYFTLQNLAMGLALTFGPAAGGGALEAGGKAALFGGMALVNVAAALAFWIALRRPREEGKPAAA